jgi:hypothetical protein
MEQSVQDQNLELGINRMAQAGSVFRGDVSRYRDVPGQLRQFGRERKNIGRVAFSAKTPI